MSDCSPALGMALANIDQTRFPAAGGLLDQTAAFAATLAIVESEMGRISQEHAEQAEKFRKNREMNGGR